ncbi:calmodulin-like 3 [Nowakowskiella sp. JEL0078]|nr:calmodulin-like 3 [Nowakowskiella sp. JEL0078]
MPLTTEQESLATETFESFDRNKDNSISIDELLRMLRRLGQRPSNDKLEEIMAEFDSDKNGSVSLKEFFKIVEGINNTEPDLKDTFEAYDTDKSGFLTSQEIRKVIVAITRDKRISNEVIDDLLANADASGDGKISYEEFAKFYSDATA